MFRVIGAGDCTHIAGNMELIPSEKNVHLFQFKLISAYCVLLGGEKNKTKHFSIVFFNILPFILKH